MEAMKSHWKCLYRIVISSFLYAKKYQAGSGMSDMLGSPTVPDK